MKILEHLECLFTDQMRDLNKDPNQEEQCWNLSSPLDPLSRCSQEKLNTSDSPAQEHLGDGEVMDHTALLTEYKNLMTGAYFQLCWLRFLATLMSLRKSMQSSIHKLDKYIAQRRRKSRPRMRRSRLLNGKCNESQAILKEQKEDKQ